MKPITYFDIYGGSLFMSILLVFSFLIIFSYFYTKQNINEIKKNWIHERCNPAIIPFAGIVNNDPKKGVFKTTADNFSGCIHSILSVVAADAFKPIYYMTNMIHTMFADMVNAINDIRTMVSKIRTDFQSISQDIMGRVLSIMMPVRHVLTKTKSAMGKTMGILTTGLFTGLGGYMSLTALIGAIIEVLIVFLIALAIATVVLLSDIFTIIPGLVLLAAFVIILVPVVMINDAIDDTMNISHSSIPSKP